MALPKKLYNKARKLDVVAFTISIEGGSDQAYLDAELEISEKRLDGKDRWTFVRGSDPHKELLTEIEEFGWEEHGHSGAGEGSAYGDRFRYDLVNNTIGRTEWYHAYQERVHDNDTLETQ